MARLGDLIKLAKVIRCDNGNYPVLSMTMHDGIILQSSRFKKSIASIDKSNYKVVQYGQLVVGFPIDEGVLYIQKVTTAGIMSPAYNIWDVDTSLIDINYLEYCLHSPQSMQFYKANLRGTTARRRSIPTDILLELFIPLPSLDEQRRIAALLDKVSDLIAKRRAQLDKLDLLVKARFVEMFGDPDDNPMNWKVSELGNHLEIVGGYAFKSEGFVDSGIPVLRIGNINSGRFLPVNMVYWPDDPVLVQYKMYPGDLVMSLTGTVGKDDYGNVCILSDEYPEYYLNQRNAKLAIRATLNKYYLSELLKFSKIKKRLTGISRGVRQANISNRDILALCVPIPPIELQGQFATFVKQTQKSKMTIQQSLDKLEILKKAFMQQYFG